ncbi:hypothetical protein [Nocardia sp. NPDC050717]|uniref:hypothetical protein n=1 Tax=Nocardia sp. NPDC050717 TaxID=3157221 RepID=UPI0033D289D7
MPAFNADAIIDSAITEQVTLGAKTKDAIRYALKKAQLRRPHSQFTTAPAATATNAPKRSPSGTRPRQRSPRAAVPREQRRRIRTDVALRMFAADVGRGPLNARELLG